MCGQLNKLFSKSACIKVLSTLLQAQNAGQATEKHVLRGLLVAGDTSRSNLATKSSGLNTQR